MTIPQSQYISTFVESQFPDFYKDEGPTFIAFVKAYYEWMEETGQPIGDARNLPNYQNIDDTLDKFVTHFQNAYLYGTPFSIRGDKRFLIKHVLDVYRAKGSVQGYKLLFRLLYNEEVDIYFPSVDVFRPSDGTWYEPNYLEITENDLNAGLYSKRIKGSSTGTEAVVENYVILTVNQKRVHVLFLSNIAGIGFEVGEKITDIEDYDTIATLDAPTIVGSVSGLNVIDGGSNFNVGDIIRATTGSGIEAEFRITETTNSSTGSISFNIVNGGTLFSTNAVPMIARRNGLGGIIINAGGSSYSNSDTLVITGSGSGGAAILTTNATGGIVNTTVTILGSGYLPGNTLVSVTTSTGSGANLSANIVIDGTGAGFKIGTLTNTVDVQYNIQLVGDFAATVLNVANYNMQAFTINATSNLVNAFSYSNATFGTIGSLANVTTGTGYLANPVVMVRDFLYSANLAGTVSYSNTSLQVTGTTTTFSNSFSTGNTFVRLQNNGANTQFDIRRVVRVVNNTVMFLDDFPVYSNTSAVHQMALPLVDTAFSGELRSLYPGGGKNEDIQASSQFGSGIISKVAIKNSGYGYFENETVTLATVGALDSVTINAGGTGYSNNDNLVFAGGSPVSPAIGQPLTHANGTIASIALSKVGSGYTSTPVVSVQTTTGSGASLTAVLGALDTTYTVTGRILKEGEGILKGVWRTTDSFSSSDKYIQDSYYYQEYSYEIRASSSLDRYADIIRKVYHPSGLELFGEFVYRDLVDANSSVVSETVTLV